MADHKNKKQNETVDAGLCGNEKIEEAIAALQQEPTEYQCPMPSLFVSGQACFF